ncbi:MAG: glycosyltransferase family 4 protein [Hahellaceae bacterium]|nr:glycosyltransferase family 4 protein [Hahellaceae bacterium]
MTSTMKNTAPIKVLSISNLYPNNVKPTFGIFVENRLVELAKTQQVDIRVIAPIPFFPGLGLISAEYAARAQINKEAERRGIKVYYQRYLHIPKIGMFLQPFFMLLALVFAQWKLKKQGWQPQIIDGHFYYPDGFASVMLGHYLGIPAVVSARGSDINDYTQNPLLKMLITWTANNAAHNITVSEALREKIIALGISTTHVTTFRNGVDTSIFTLPQQLLDKALPNPVILSVGNLIPLKGHHIIIEALANIPNATLVIAGDGPEKQKLLDLAKALSVESRVVFTGRLGQSDLISQYQNASVLVLASEKEGWPNVVLEALACGTPVVATAVGGVPEIIQSGPVAKLSERTPNALADAITQLLKQNPTAKQCREHAEKFTWQATTQGILGLYKNIVGSN